ncbi:MAG: UDP-GlcNAc--UDP-phosphate GlcNAc-1-phosphate transferase [Bacteroidota bacterium]
MKTVDHFIVFIAVLLFELFYIKVAKKMSIVDKPNHRTLHSGDIVRGGGIIFPAGYFIYHLWSGSGDIYFLTGVILLTLISYADDLGHVPGFLRLSFQFLAVIFMFIELEILNEWGLLLTLFALIISCGVLNAFNFMDGINGITAAYSISVLLFFGIIHLVVIPFIDIDLIIVMLTSLLVFSLFNFRKSALCFSGDVGSVLIGFIITYLMLKLILITGSLIWIMLLLVYGIDVVITLIQRLQRGDNIFNAHRLHLFQLIVANLKLSHLKVSVYYTMMQIVVSTATICIYMFGSEARLLWSVLVLSLSSIYYLLLKSKITGGVWLPKEY